MNAKESFVIHSDVAHYYANKLSLYGASPRGVDWNGEDGQLQRFKELSRILRSKEPFSIVDIGCGYGAYFDFLEKSYENFSYFGMDIAKNMIEAAKTIHADSPGAQFEVGSAPPKVYDYCVASGIFNVRFGYSDLEWCEYIKNTLKIMNKSSSLGFSFNCLTSYSDVSRRRGDLYYADPCELFDFCKKNFSMDVALIHDYGLYEFTIIVKKAA